MKYTFDELVAARAKVRMGEKISEFRIAIMKAMQKLCLSFAPTSWTYGYPDLGKKCLSFVANGARESEWPPELWEAEREIVGKELMATMDAMQQAIVAVQKQESKEGAND